MAFLGPKEAIEVAGARPELLSALSRLMDAWEKQTGGKTMVPRDGGVRTNARQAQLDAESEGKYAVAAAGNSHHEYGAAVDLHILSGGDYKQLAAIAFSVGLVNRKRQREFDPADPFHFQLDESLATVKAKWDALQKKNCSACASRSRSSSPSSR